MKKRGWIVFSIIFVLIAGLLSFHFYFLRDPEATIPEGNVIVSPASGKIIKIMEINGSGLEKISMEKGLAGKVNVRIDDVCNSSCIIVSIFMSPFDIHIQRASFSGKILSIEHKAGTFFLTTTFENGLTNEKTEILMENDDIGRFKIIQIAGIIVRRIETWVAEGQKLEKGERIGLIKYGSQVSIILPKDKVEITAKEGKHVESGSSIIAKVK